MRFAGSLLLKPRRKLIAGGERRKGLHATFSSVLSGVISSMSCLTHYTLQTQVRLDHLVLHRRQWPEQQVALVTMLLASTGGPPTDSPATGSSATTSPDTAGYIRQTLWLHKHLCLVDLLRNSIA